MIVLYGWRNFLEFGEWGFWVVRNGWVGGLGVREEYDWKNGDKIVRGERYEYVFVGASIKYEDFCILLEC